MSNEITTTINLTVSNGNLKHSYNTGNLQEDQASANKSVVTQSIATSAGGTAVTIAAGVATLGVALFRNLDSTNYVELGVVVSATFYPVVRINAGKAALFRLAQGITLYARANTAAVVIESQVMAD